MLSRNAIPLHCWWDLIWRGIALLLCIWRGASIQDAFTFPDEHPPAMPCLFSQMTTHHYWLRGILAMPSSNALRWEPDRNVNAAMPLDCIVSGCSSEEAPVTMSIQMRTEQKWQAAPGNSVAYQLRWGRGCGVKYGEVQLGVFCIAIGHIDYRCIDTFW